MLAWCLSDLHLQSADGRHARILRRFLAGPARQARDLYLLGDLFEAWIGDDDDAAIGREVAEALAAAAASGLRIGLLHGNRDFLLGREFAHRCGARLLPDPCVVEFAGVPTLLSHGDAYCTDDLPYQAVRARFRDPSWQAQFLAQPLAARRQFAEQARRQSAEHQRGATMELMDVNAGAIEDAFRLYGVARMIHGHTHRPGEHRHAVDGRACERWVLSDWREAGEALAIDAGGRLRRVALGEAD